MDKKRRKKYDYTVIYLSYENDNIILGVTNVKGYNHKDALNNFRTSHSYYKVQTIHKKHYYGHHTRWACKGVP